MGAVCGKGSQPLDPSATQPSAPQQAEKPQPAAAQPSATQPSATQPSATQPSAPQPSATQPSATQPQATPRKTVADSQVVVDRLLGTLQVTVQAAKELDEGGFLDKSDPYVKINLVGSDKVANSAVAWNAGSNAIWRENFFLSVKEGQTEMKCIVLDKDDVTDDDLLGSCVINLKPILDRSGELVNEWYGLKDAKSAAAGKLNLICRFLPAPPLKTTSNPGYPSGVLTVTLEKGLDIKETVDKEKTGLKSIDPYVVVSMGEFSFRTTTKYNNANPAWGETIRLFLPRGHDFQIIRFALYDKDFITSDDSISTAELKVAEACVANATAKMSLDLLPNAHRYGAQFENGPTMGQLELSVTFEPIASAEQRFWLEWFNSMDFDGSGTLQQEEFAEFVQAVSTMQKGRDECKKIFDKANKNQDDGVSVSELSDFLCSDQSDVVIDENIFKDWLNSPINNDPSAKMMGGGFNVENQASGTSYLAMLSDWNQDSASFEKGLNQGQKARHILVWNREKGILEEEVIHPCINLGMRMLYQSAFGAMLRKTKKVSKMIKDMSENQGKKYDDPHSAGHIHSFVNSFHINMEECQLEIKEFKTFNEFFYRKLKASARPIASPEDPKIVVQPADCRLMVFETISEATKFWIKGKEFTVGNMLNSQEEAKRFMGGAISIHRLAPQDYHRFHIPVDCKIKSQTLVEGELWTVNPVAINMVDVFTENKRTVCYLETEQYGTVAFIAVGAHMVGSMDFTLKTGDSGKKGDDFGYFFFGGSTVICVWEKGAVKFDDDLVKRSLESTETLVKMGAPLAQGLRN